MSKKLEILPSGVKVNIGTESTLTVIPSGFRRGWTFDDVERNMAEVYGFLQEDDEAILTFCISKDSVKEIKEELKGTKNEKDICFLLDKALKMGIDNLELSEC